MYKRQELQEHGGPHGATDEKAYKWQTCAVGAAMDLGSLGYQDEGELSDAINETYPDLALLGGAFYRNVTGNAHEQALNTIEAIREQVRRRGGAKTCRDVMRHQIPAVQIRKEFRTAWDAIDSITWQHEWPEAESLTNHLNAAESRMDKAIENKDAEALAEMVEEAREECGRVLIACEEAHEAIAEKEAREARSCKTCGKPLGPGDDDVQLCAWHFMCAMTGARYYADAPRQR